MVNGVKVFKDYFSGHEDKYIIIGGTACDIQIEDVGLNPRATKDIDLILIVEALNKGFVEQFWEFIKMGNYKKNEKGEGERNYYRFVNPEKKEFPLQLELFARTSHILDIDENVHLTPIPADDDLSSLSAILMNEEYYSFTLNHCHEQKGINIADIPSLIVLKARAFLDWINKSAGGGHQGSQKNIKKHKNDVFRLIPLLSPNYKVEIPELIHNDLKEFSKVVGDDIPSNDLFKHMGLPLNSKDVWAQFKNIFELY